MKKKKSILYAAVLTQSPMQPYSIQANEYS